MLLYKGVEEAGRLCVPPAISSSSALAFPPHKGFALLRDFPAAALLRPAHADVYT